MPARRSQDPSLTPAERAGEGALAHWDEQRRRRAVPTSLERSLPDRDNWGEGATSSDDADGDGESRTCTDGDQGGDATDAPSATDQ